MPPAPTSTTRPPLRERKKLRAREHIVEVAYSLFEQRGFAAVTVTDIVDAAEVSRSTFFRYFGDKQEVVFADQQRFHDELVTAAGGAHAPPPRDLHAALAQLRELAVGAYRMAGERPRSEVHERLIDANPELLDRHVRKLMGFAQDMTALLIARGAESGTARLAAHLTVGCCLAARADAAPGEMAAAVARQFDAILALGDH